MRKRIVVVTGSRADYGLLSFPIKRLEEEGCFEVEVLRLWGLSFSDSHNTAYAYFADRKPYLVLVLGDRFEILAATTAAHLLRTPVAHIAGGDVTEGSYDDAMRDCISRMASVHFVTSNSAMARLAALGYRNIHLVGNPSVDVIVEGSWRKDRPIEKPYVVVSYQPETIDGTADWPSVVTAVGDRNAVFFLPNRDEGSSVLSEDIRREAELRKAPIHAHLPHAEFLNLIAHCEEFIGNSSAMIYEAPRLSVKTTMIGKRQKGRVLPWGDGNASKRIVNILKYTNV